MTNVFSVDLEDWFQGLEIDMKYWAAYAPRLRAGLDPLLDLLEQYSTRATFFVLGYQAERTPDIIRDLAGRGHEIASHGYSHRFVYTQTPAEFRSDVSHSRKILEDLTGMAIEGYRAPFFSITNASLWAHDILLDEGFLYDSSVFPVKNYRYGIPGAQRHPDWLLTESGRQIFEIPLSTARVSIGGNLHGMNIPMSGGGYFRLYPYALTQALTRRIHREGSRLIFYVHPWEYDQEHPRVEMPRRFARFTHYHNLASTIGKTEHLLQDFEFGTMADAFSARFRKNTTDQPSVSAITPVAE